MAHPERKQRVFTFCCKTMKIDGTKNLFTLIYSTSETYMMLLTLLQIKKNPVPFVTVPTEC